MTHARCITWKRIFLVMLGALAAQQFAVAGPDLVINKRLLKTSVELERRGFDRRSCDYREGCLYAVGRRKLLKVDVGLANVGPHDLVIGSPRGRSDNLFVYSDCHDHYHMKTMVKYRLLNLNYSKVTRARKQAFCLRDNFAYTGWAGPSKGYHCDFQGITAGWQDVYDKSLDCQYVDVTGVPPGSYLLEVTVNPVHAVGEQNYNNNKVIVFVRIPRMR